MISSADYANTYRWVNTTHAPELNLSFDYTRTGGGTIWSNHNYYVDWLEQCTNTVPANRYYINSGGTIVDARPTFKIHGSVETPRAKSDSEPATKEELRKFILGGGDKD